MPKWESVPTVKLNEIKDGSDPILRITTVVLILYCIIDLEGKTNMKKARWHAHVTYDETTLKVTGK